MNAAPPEDWESALTDKEQKECDDGWKLYGGFVIHHTVYPATRLKNKCYREFKARMMQVTVISRMITQMLDSLPKVKTQTKVGPNTNLTTEADPCYTPHDVLGYYWGLRVLMYAWAKAGAFYVESVVEKGTMVFFMPLWTAIDYADQWLQTVSTADMPDSEKLAWGERKDRSTRSLMSSYVRVDNGCMPGGEALNRAIREGGLLDGNNSRANTFFEENDNGLECNTGGGGPGTGANATELGGFANRQRTSQRARKANKMPKTAQPAKNAGNKGVVKGGGKGKAKSGKDGVFRNMYKGQNLCSLFNLASCSKKERDCPKWHVHMCGYGYADGSICGKTSHGLAGHR